jgi:hypothetical protein
MPLFPTADVKRTLKVLHPLAQRFIIEDIMQCGVAATAIPAEAALMLWLAECLEGLTFLTPAQRFAVLSTIKPYLCRELADGWLEPEAFTSSHLPFILAFREGRYATWHGLTGLLDLETGEVGPGPASPVFESLAYNLTVLYRRRIAQLASTKEGTRGEPRNAAGDSTEVLDGP